MDGKIPKSYFLFAFVIGLMLLSRPLWVDVKMPLLPIAAIFLAAGYAASIYGILYLRSKSPIVLSDNGLRESASLLKPLTTSSSMGGDFPPMTTFNVGGAAALQAGYPNKNIIHVARSAVESFGRRVLLVYSPLQPIDGRLFEGVSGADYDVALKAAHSGFLPKSAFVYFSFLNTLRGEDTEEMKRAIDLVVTKHARPTQEDRSRARKGSEAFIADLKAVAQTATKKKAKEKLSNFFLPPEAAEMKEQQEVMKQRAQ